MDFGGLLFLALIWLLFKLVGRSREANAKAPPRPPAPPGAPTGGDPTQREGGQLERLLRELERTISQASAGPADRPATVRLPPGKHPGEREVPEAQSRVVSLETEVRRAERVVVDQDDEAEQVVARRVAAAAARSGPLTRADHEAFDRRIRQEPADHTAVVRLSAQQLRDAVIWREVLGPPVSERDS